MSDSARAAMMVGLAISWSVSLVSRVSLDRCRSSESDVCSSKGTGDVVRSVSSDRYRSNDTGDGAPRKPPLPPRDGVPLPVPVLAPDQFFDQNGEVGHKHDGEDAERHRLDQQPLLVVRAEEIHAFRGSDVNVEVEASKYAVHLVDLVRPLHVAAGKNSEHLEVVKTDTDQRKIHLVLDHESTKCDNECNGNDEDDDEKNVVVRAFLALAVKVAEKLGFNSGLVRG